LTPAKSVFRKGIEGRNPEGWWFGLIRPIAFARIPPTNLALTWLISLWSKSALYLLWTINQLGVI